jgi:hypothetical protein
MIAAGFGTSLERLFALPILAWLFGHTHWSSWQHYQRDVTQAADGGGSSGGREEETVSHKWRSLTGGLSQWPNDEELAGSPVLFGHGVLLASNQLGYASKGEHVVGGSLNCNQRCL